MSDTPHAWFKWRKNGTNTWINSYDMNIWINQMPPVTKPEQKVEFVDVPGRARGLTLSEGDYAYKCYLKKITILVPLYKYVLSPIISQDPVYIVDYNRYPQLVAIHEWLRGDGFLQLSTEPDYRYRAYIAGEIAFKKIAPDLVQAVVPFYCQPDRMTVSEIRIQYDAEGEGGSDPVIDETFTVSGNVPTWPTIYFQRLHASGEDAQDIELTFERIDPDDDDAVLDTQTMKFYDMTTGSVHINCAAMICTNSNEDALWAKKVEGDYFEWLPGTWRCVVNADTRVIIHVNWRWV